MVFEKAIFGGTLPPLSSTSHINIYGIPALICKTEQSHFVSLLFNIYALQNALCRGRKNSHKFVRILKCQKWGMSVDVSVDACVLDPASVSS